MKKSNESLSAINESEEVREKPKKYIESMATILHANNSPEKSDTNVVEYEEVTFVDSENSSEDVKQSLVVVSNEDETEYCLLAVLISGTMLIIFSIASYLAILFISLMDNLGYHFG